MIAGAVMMAEANGPENCDLATALRERAAIMEPAFRAAEAAGRRVYYSGANARDTAAAYEAVLWDGMLNLHKTSEWVAFEMKWAHCMK